MSRRLDSDKVTYIKELNIYIDEEYNEVIWHPREIDYIIAELIAILHKLEIPVDVYAHISKRDDNMLALTILEDEAS